jgi:hypothetical protein
VPFSFASMAGATLPLLAPAVMLFVAYGRRSAVLPQRLVHVIATTLLIAVLLFLAGVALFAHQDQRTYSTPTSAGSTSDVITYAESVASLSIVAGTVVLAWLRSTPRR